MLLGAYTLDLDKTGQKPTPSIINRSVLASSFTRLSFSAILAPSYIIASMVGLIQKLQKAHFKRGRGPKEWALFGLSILCSGFFVWAGIQIIILSDSLSTTTLAILGTLEVVAGVILASSYYHWSVGFAVIVLGFYSFARAGDIIKRPFLGYLLALASWVAGAFLIYATYPDTKPKTKNPGKE
jgi:hypothetical protein